MRTEDLLPGWRSAFILHRFDGLVTECQDCTVVRTPGHPTYYWGNFLLLPDAPRDRDLVHWRARFQAEIGRWQPATLHVAIGVNQPRLAEPLPSWLADGFDVNEEVVLQLLPSQLCTAPRAARGEIVFRQLDLATELDAVVALQCADNHPFDRAGFTQHRQRQMARFAAMARQGKAAWFGVWCDGVLAADCGLMREGPDAGPGRFQHVSTHPGWRRRGLCTALVQGVCAWGFGHWRLPSLLMCADPHDVAIGIYRSLGFQRMTSEWSLQRYAPIDEAARRSPPAAGA